MCRRQRQDQQARARPAQSRERQRGNKVARPPADDKVPRPAQHGDDQQHISHRSRRLGETVQCEALQEGLGGHGLGGSADRSRPCSEVMLTGLAPSAASLRAPDPQNRLRPPNLRYNPMLQGPGRPIQGFIVSDGRVGYGQRRGGRRPVGRRGQGQDRRLAVASAPTSSCASRAATTPATRWSSAARPTSCRCCPRASCGRASSAIIGNGVVVDPWALVDEIEKLGGQGVQITPRQPARRRERRADPAAAPRARPVARECRRARPRSARPAAASARPTRTRSAAAPSASPTSPTPRRLDAKIERLLAHHNALRRGLGQPQIDAGAAHGRAGRDRAEGPAVRRRRLASCSTSAARPASASCSRARRARCSTSTTAPIPSSPRPTPWRRRPRPAPASGRAPSATCWASPRPTPRASATGRSRPSCTTRSASCSASAATSSAPSPAARAAAAGSTRCWCARRSRSRGIDGIALTKLDVLDGFEEIKICVGYRLDGERIDCLPAGQRARRRGSSRSTRRSRAGAQSTRGRTLLGRPAGAGRQIRPPHRGADRRPVALLSTSPERDDTILMRDPFAD